MGTSQSGAAVAANSINFVDENDAGAGLAGLVEQVADSARTDPDKHLDEFGTGDGEERHVGFAGGGLGHQCLPGTRRPHEQDPGRNASPQFNELLRFLEKLHNLLQLLLGLVVAGHGLEVKGDGLTHDHARLALAEHHGLGVCALALPHDQEKQSADEDDRQQIEDKPEPPTSRTGHVGDERDILQVRRRHAEDVEGFGKSDARFLAADSRLAFQTIDHLDLVAPNYDLFNRALADLAGQRAERQFVRGAAHADGQIEQQGNGCHQYQAVNEVSAAFGTQTALTIPEGDIPYERRL